ncbi:hypothetical protein BLOT_005607, partial [Blomia tropicalis]
APLIEASAEAIFSNRLTNSSLSTLDKLGRSFCDRLSLFSSTLSGPDLSRFHPRGNSFDSSRLSSTSEPDAILAFGTGSSSLEELESGMIVVVRGTSEFSDPSDDLIDFDGNLSSLSESLLIIDFERVTSFPSASDDDDEPDDDM